MPVCASRSAEFLSKPDENPFRSADVAKAIRVLVLDNFAHELRAMSAEILECLVDVVHREHYTKIAQCVHRGGAVIRHSRRCEKA